MNEISKKNLKFLRLKKKIDEESYEKLDKDWEMDNIYIDKKFREYGIDNNRKILARLLISKYFSGREAIELLLITKDIPLDKFTINIFYFNENNCENSKKIILNSFRLLIKNFYSVKEKRLFSKRVHSLNEFHSQVFLILLTYNFTEEEAFQLITKYKNVLDNSFHLEYLYDCIENSNEIEQKENIESLLKLLSIINLD